MVPGPVGKGSDCKSVAPKGTVFDSQRRLQNQKGNLMKIDHGLYTEFSDHINSLKSEGLVDFKTTIFVEPTTTVQSVILTLNNIFRLRAEGSLKKLDIN